MNIGILGCGWLGLPLAKELIEEGYKIKGSTTSKDKLNELSNAGIEDFLISLNEEGIQGNIEKFLEGIDALIINIPPKLRGNKKENFVSKILYLIGEIEDTSIKRILFIGSTAIYANNNAIITEKTKPEPETESGIQLLKVEEILSANPNFKTTILRFGGLFNDDRHPANFLSGRKNVMNPNAPVNLIHLSDCIKIIKLIIKKNIWGNTFNAALPNHPTKKEYYTKQSLKKGLEPPEFNSETLSQGKIIDSTKLINELNYKFEVYL
jgi:nucleoside-diphosphate-sugar epimerase